MIVRGNMHVVHSLYVYYSRARAQNNEGSNLARASCVRFDAVNESNDRGDDDDDEAAGAESILLRRTGSSLPRPRTSLYIRSVCRSIARREFSAAAIEPAARIGCERRPRLFQICRSTKSGVLRALFNRRSACRLQVYTV